MCCVGLLVWASQFEPSVFVVVAHQPTHTHKMIRGKEVSGLCSSGHFFDEYGKKSDFQERVILQAARPK